MSLFCRPMSPNPPGCDKFAEKFRKDFFKSALPNKIWQAWLPAFEFPEKFLLFPAYAAFSPDEIGNK